MKLFCMPYNEHNFCIDRKNSCDFPLEITDSLRLGLARLDFGKVVANKAITINKQEFLETSSHFKLHPSTEWDLSFFLISVLEK